MFNVVLFEPEIPPNTGNIMRLCTNTGAKLHLIYPLGFKIKAKELRRAGLDYIDWSTVCHYKNFDDYIDKPKFGICKLVDEEIDPIFKTDLITTFSNWHPVHKANKIHSTSNMIIIDSSTAEAPLESLFDKIEIEYFWKVKP